MRRHRHGLSQGSPESQHVRDRRNSFTDSPSLSVPEAWRWTVKFSWCAVLVVAAGSLVGACSPGPAAAPSRQPKVGWTSVRLPSPAKSREQQEELERRSAAQEAGKIAEEYDEFTKRKTIALKDMSVRGDDGRRVKVLVTGAPGNPEARLVFASGGSAWNYLHCHSVDILADQVPVALSSAAEHDGRVISKGVVELVSVQLTAENLSQISKATELKARVCSDIFNFRPWHVAKLAAFVEALQTSAPTTQLELPAVQAAP